MNHAITIGDIIFASGAVLSVIALVGLIAFVVSAIAGGFKD
jgi:hypothetical protein